MNSPTEKVIHHFVILLTDVRIDEKNHATATDFSRINFDNLFCSFIFHQSLIKICQLYPNHTVNYQNPFLCIYCMKNGHYFGWVTLRKKDTH